MKLWHKQIEVIILKTIVDAVRNAEIDMLSLNAGDLTDRIVAALINEVEGGVMADISIDEKKEYTNLGSTEVKLTPPYGYRLITEAEYQHLTKALQENERLRGALQEIAPSSSGVTLDITDEAKVMIYENIAARVLSETNKGST